MLILHHRLVRPLEQHPARKRLAERPEPDCQVGHQLLIGMAQHPRRRAPWQELRILAHVCHQREHLLGRVRQRALLGVGRHYAIFSGTEASCRARASRNCAKSASA